MSQSHHRTDVDKHLSDILTICRIGLGCHVRPSLLPSQQRRHLSQEHSPRSSQERLGGGELDSSPSSRTSRRVEEARHHGAPAAVEPGAGRYKKRDLQEQGAICCYCESRVTIGNSHVEHFRPKERFRQHQLKYDNLHCSCQRELKEAEPRHCGHSKGSWFNSRLISPLERDCGEHFTFTGSGEIRPRLQGDCAAKITIEKLRLNIPKLRALRARPQITHENIIHGFRGISELSLDFSNQINVIVGGKSAILDCTAILIRSSTGTGRFFSETDINNSVSETQNSITLKIEDEPIYWRVTKNRRGRKQYITGLDESMSRRLV